MNIQLSILTPVHIGSGHELQPNIEFLPFADKIAVTDDEKILQIIGKENIDEWIKIIGNPNGDLRTILNQGGRNVSAEEVSSRIMQKASIVATKSIRAQIHSGNGQAMIPGSSIKGAIRTAIFASFINENQKMVAQKASLGTTDRAGRFKFGDSELQKTIFGKDPNHDIMRLLQVGDAHFEQTTCYKTQVLNKHFEKWSIKADIEQNVEAIPTSAAKTTIRINFNESLFLLGNKERLFNKNAIGLELIALFQLINKHTGILLSEEIDFWRDKANSPEALGTYIDDLEMLLAKCDDAHADECILRLGYGTGFRSITGDWQGAMNDENYEQLVKSIRPKFDGNLLFPKTTRFAEGGAPLGFIKLKMIN
jgi:CRISPR-associated protein Csm5